jgi:hypothetical protein
MQEKRKGARKAVRGGIRIVREVGRVAGQAATMILSATAYAALSPASALRLLARLNRAETARERSPICIKAQAATNLSRSDWSRERTSECPPSAISLRRD